MEFDFQSIMRLIRGNRDVYGRILKFNKDKVEALEYVKIDDFKEIIDKEIRLVDELLKEDNQELAIISDLVSRWKALSNAGVLKATSQVKAMEASESKVENLKQLILRLKELLEKEKTSYYHEIKIKLFLEEKILHKQIRIAYFQLLRSLIDYLKNVEENKPLIYIVIPARNEEKFIEPTLRKIRNQRYPNKRIIVVDSASEDETAEKAKLFADEVIRLEKRGVSKARNAGVELALRKGADIIVQLDADSHMRPDLLDKTWEAVYLDGNVAGISKTKLDKTHARAKIFNLLHHLNRIVWKVPHTFMFGTKEVFREIKYDENLELGEDVNWSHRVIRKYGSKLFKVITKTWLVTSARRLEKGYAATIWRWAKVWPFGLVTGKKDDAYFDEKF